MFAETAKKAIVEIPLRAHAHASRKT